MKQKIKVLLAGFLIVLLVLTGCAKEKPLIQRPMTGEYSPIYCSSFREVFHRVGLGSFPNKRILRNNLCLPACE